MINRNLAEGWRNCGIKGKDVAKRNIVRPYGHFTSQMALIIAHMYLCGHKAAYLLNNNKNELKYF